MLPAGTYLLLLYLSVRFASIVGRDGQQQNLSVHLNELDNTIRPQENGHRLNTDIGKSGKFIWGKGEVSRLEVSAKVTCYLNLLVRL